ncbi:MAG: amidohydrolase family protein [Ilumatobacteraceae bacterium]
MAATGGIVDSHVHLLPGRIGEKVRAIFEAGETAGRFVLAYPSGHDEVVSQLRAEGVVGVWSLPYAHKPGVAEGLNEASATVAARFTDGAFRVTGGATVHPGDEDPAGIVHGAVARHGLRVLKLHCSVGDFGVDDPRLTPALAAAEEHRMPTVVHLGHNPNGLTEGHELDSLRTVCARHPGLPVVLAHFGHHSAPEAVALFAEFANFHADLTPVVTSAPNVTSEMLSLWADRILFGSDSPNTAVSVTDHLAWLGSFGLDDPAVAAITGGNARRLEAAVAA